MKTLKSLIVILVVLLTCQIISAQVIIKRPNSTNNVPAKTGVAPAQKGAKKTNKKTNKTPSGNYSASNKGLIDVALDRYLTNEKDDDNFANLINLWQVQPEAVEKAIIKRMIKNPKITHWPLLCCNITFNTGEYDKTLEYALRLKEIDEDNGNVFLGKVYYCLEDYSKSTKYYKKCSGLYLDDWLMYSDAQSKLGDFDYSNSLYEFFLEDRENNGLATDFLKHAIGMNYLRVGKPEMAVKYFQDLAENGNTNDIPILALAGDALYKNKRVGEAVKYWNKAKKLFGNCVDLNEIAYSRDWMPMIYANLGMRDEAENMAKQIIKYMESTEDYSSAYNIACYYSRIEDENNALKYLQYSLDDGLDPYEAEIDYDMQFINHSPKFKLMIYTAKARRQNFIKQIEDRAKIPLNKLYN